MSECEACKLVGKQLCPVHGDPRAWEILEEKLSKEAHGAYDGFVEAAIGAATGQTHTPTRYMGTFARRKKK